MSVSTVLIAAALIALLAAVTGIIPKRDGGVGAILTSPRTRWGMAACSIIVGSIGIYMWDHELKQQAWIACKDCPADLQKLRKEIAELREEIDRTQDNINKSADFLYEDSSQFLLHVAALIGKKTNIGCKRELAIYLDPDRSVPGGPDTCSQIRLLKYPVTINADGIDTAQLVRTLLHEGIPAYISNGKLEPANSKELAILIPDGVGKDVVCKARNAFEQQFKKKNPSSTKPAIRYALGSSRVTEVNKGRLVISSQTVQLGIKLSEFATNVDEISDNEWKDACAGYYQKEFEALVEIKSRDAKGAVVPPPGSQVVIK